MASGHELKVLGQILWKMRDTAWLLVLSGLEDNVTKRKNSAKLRSSEPSPVGKAQGGAAAVTLHGCRNIHRALPRFISTVQYIRTFLISELCIACYLSILCIIQAESLTLRRLDFCPRM